MAVLTFDDIPDQTPPSTPQGKGPLTFDDVPDDKQTFSATKMIQNIPWSAMQFGSNIKTAITHPVDTAKTLAKTAIGGVEKLIPGEQGREKDFDKFSNLLKQRYGSMDAIKRTAQNDPVGFAADLAATLSG